MKIVALTLARNEDWVLNLSLGVSLRWCDHIVFLDHASTDQTRKIAERYAAETGRVTILEHAETERWDEMEIRQRTLEVGRSLGGTHFAIVDADEVLTANLIPEIRNLVALLKPGQLMDLPMIPTWRNLCDYRNDESVWARAVLTTAFCDAPLLCWKPGVDGYEHHARPPYGHREDRLWTVARGNGGVMHLQFADWRRLLTKHVLYRMVDHLRWPGRESPNELNKKYDRALDENGLGASKMPESWWEPGWREKVRLEGKCWHEEEIKRLLQEYGRNRFTGLDLKGF